MGLHRYTVGPCASVMAKSSLDHMALKPIIVRGEALQNTEQEGPHSQRCAAQARSYSVRTVAGVRWLLDNSLRPGPVRNTVFEANLSFDTADNHAR